VTLSQLSELYLPAIEAHLQEVVDLAAGDGLTVEMRAMLAYHMGWEGEGAGETARGKRVRPLLVLLVAAAAGGDWSAALPAAASVELIHNFSLLHDDIQDGSPLRRGRPTAWKLWGIPQAINAGDAMFTLAQEALLGLEAHLPARDVLRAARILQATCLALTQGQYLDLSYEARGDLTLEAYWPMVSGKTAALLSACTELGALAAGAGARRCDAYSHFGRDLGLAFQALDDLLGIWGNAALTGKSAESDLVAGKKSLPMLYALGRDGPFARRWSQGDPIRAGEVPALADQLEAEGARAYTQDRAAELTEQALAALEEAGPRGLAGEALKELADRLLARRA
jgi:geranylgeranyl diphosphate synthase type I